jgi:large subunit ribosomal protein L6
MEEDVSRIGRMPVIIPDGVQVEVKGSKVIVKGPNGELESEFRSEMKIERKDDAIVVERPSDAPQMRSLHGLTRSLINNMVVGVSEGFSKTLEVQGVGYRPELQGKDLILHVGYSHPVTVEPADGIEFEVDTKARTVVVKGPDKQVVGQVAADIRKIRPPEPYKGKGIRYQGEYVRRKAGKAGKVMA